MASGLTSDHVNYLIWRYLQERGYGKSAVQLSREWATNDPQKLPFAASVKPQTLISVLQDGLAFDRLSANASNEHDAATKPPEQVKPQDGRRYTFTDFRAPRKSEAQERKSRSTSSNVPAVGHKRPSISAQTPGVPPHTQSIKKKSSKAPNLNVKTSADAMDIDNSGHAQGAEKEKEVGQEEEEPQPEVAIEVKEEPAPPPPPPSTLEIGQSVGTQSEVFVDKTIAGTQWNSSLPKTDICYLDWDSKDPNKFTILGGSSWHYISMPSNTDDNVSDVSPTITANEVNWTPGTRRYFVFGYARSSRNLITAFATEVLHKDRKISHQLRLHRSSEPEQILTTLSATPTILRFNMDASLLLGCAPCGKTGNMGQVSVWLLSWMRERRQFFLPLTLTLSRPVIDAEWIDESTFVVSGEGFVNVFEVVHSLPLGSGTVGEQSTADKVTPKLSLVHEVDDPLTWYHLRFDRKTRQLGCIAEGEARHFALLGPGPTHPFRLTRDAHDDYITALEFQPIRDARDASDERPDVGDASRTLATSSSDGTVKLWDAHAEGELHTMECAHTWTTEPPAPAAIIAWSPSGKLLAAAGDRSINVWRVGGKRELVYRWTEAAPEEEPRKEGGQSAPAGDAHRGGGGGERIHVDNGQAPNPKEKDAGAETGKDGANQAGKDGKAAKTSDADAGAGACSAREKPAPEEVEEDDSLRTLSWNVDGTRLVYTLNDKVRRTPPSPPWVRLLSSDSDRAGVNADERIHRSR